MINLRIKLNLLKKEWYETDEDKNAFITLTVWKKDHQDDYGNDYSIRQNAPREVREAMKQAGQAIPFVGDGRMFNANHTADCIEVILERSQIDPSSLYKGEKYTFLDCTLSHVPEKDKGETSADYYCFQTPTKAARLRGAKGKRIGVGMKKEIKGGIFLSALQDVSAQFASPSAQTRSTDRSGPATPPPANPAPLEVMGDDDIPF